jgi:hypothetical protein
MLYNYEARESLIAAILFRLAGFWKAEVFIGLFYPLGDVFVLGICAAGFRVIRFDSSLSKL